MMTGWKTWAAGIGSILGGAAMIANSFATGDYSHMAEGWGLVVGGLAIIGIGHKVDRLKP